MKGINGFLLVDKPVGITSFDVIRSLRRITGVKKIGHTGTLDPFASGLLVCAVGSFTRLCTLVEAEDKSYIAEVKLGEKTDTGDTEGKVIECSSAFPDAISESELSAQVLGLSELAIPKYSAVKVKGKPAYEYARSGVELELSARAVRITEFSIISYAKPFLTYSCRVSKGTYIRSLSEYIALQLGTVGYTTELRRISIGSVRVNAASALVDLNPENYQSRFAPVKAVLAGYPQKSLSDDIIRSLLNGQNPPDTGLDTDRIIVLDEDGNICSVAERKAGLLYPLINLS